MEICRKKQYKKCRTGILVAAGILLGVMLGVGTTAQAAVSQDGKYNYELDAEGKAVLTAYLGQDTEVAVPATMDGITVASLSGTFRNHDKITKVKIPAGIVSVNETAFAGCYGISSFEVDPANQNLCNDGSSEQGWHFMRPVSCRETSEFRYIPDSVRCCQYWRICV